ncbi:autotransporter-associated beta strand repeat-containing protein [Luteibacter flocculans]|uniref:Autotransporter-associated beta strand repeat-containing protein n=1 Tax=Luteibacter flocculans TaxID=2780091 RepID=A0ABY4T499_9GAMM|nr:autotransporter-associated beta strand repeat-containing protein [Luteibacter flocculans]URL59020.1 autotransporter-associated beta strand repeat-containing protein [Luteibacter flocculans]
MNRIFRIVWNRTLGQLVVTSELGRRSSGGSVSGRRARDARTTVLPLAALAAALSFATPAFAAGNLGMPAGALLDINNGTAPNSASNVANQFQNYSVTFTATDSGNNYVLFAFRQDPAYWTFGNVGLYAAGDTTTNLFTNPLFTQGGSIGSSGVQAPANWGVVYQTGTVPEAAGTWNAPGQGDKTTTNVNTSTAGSWYDGAVGSFDGIYQGVDLVAGTVYTISFTALSNNAANVAGAADGGVEMGVYAGKCVNLTGPVANCAPDNPGFQVLATPNDAANAGGPTVVTVDPAHPETTTGVSTTDVIFDGGTLTVDQTNPTLGQDVAITHNGGTIDQDGRDATFTGTISDETSGTPGDLNIVNSGNGGTVTLTGTNTYTGETTIDNGATLALSGNGSIAQSSGVTNNGTLDVSLASGNENVASLGGHGNVQLGTNALTITNGHDTYTGTIGGTGGVNVTGGTQGFTGTSTYTGGTHVSGGATVSIDNGAALGTGAIALNNGTLDTTQTTTLGNTIDVTGTGTVDTATGTTLTHSGAVTGSGDFVKNGDGTLAQTGNLTQSGATIVNDGTLVLSGTNTYGGGTVVNTGGTLEVSNDANLGGASSNLALDGGTLHTTDTINSDRNVVLSGAGHFDVDADTTMATGGTASGTGTLVKDGEGRLVIGGVASHTGGTVVNDGILVLTNHNTYTGGNTINGGTLQVQNDSSLGDASNGIAFNGGSLHTTGTFTTARNLSLNGSGTIATDVGTTLTATGNVSGASGLVKNGGGTLDIEGVASHTGGTTVNTGTLILGGNNTYTGGNTINGGTLQVSSDANLGDAANGIAFNGGSLHTTGTFTTARNLSLNGSGTIATDVGTTLTATGNVSGASGLVKNGGGTLDIEGVASHTGGTTVNTGTLILGGNNTYTGGNTINGGTLQVSSDANLGDAANGIAFNGGSLHTTGTFTTARNLSLNGSGTIATDVGTTLTATGNVSGASGLVKNGGGTLDIEGVASHTGGTTVNAGTLILGGNNTYTGGNTINGGTLQVSSDANLGDASSNIAINGGNLTVTSTMSTDRDIQIGSHGAQITTLDGVTLNQRGDISGSGGLVKLGGGTMIVYGNNTFTGGTLIQGGVIRINTGSSLGTGQILLEGGTLQSDASLGTGQEVLITGNSGVNVAAGTTTVLSGNLLAGTGNGCFVKSGKGYLSLTGRSMLASGTCVEDGVLSANGQLSSSFVQVDTGAMLRGVGVINGPVNVAGRLAAGNSPGTLTVAGTVTMQAGSSLQVDIDGLGTGNGAGNYSRVLVVGAGNRFVADGTLVPTLRGITGNASNTYTPALGSTYRIVTADGGVQGRFASIAQPAAGLPANARFLAFYGANDGHSIDLRVAPVSYATLLGDGAKRNAQAVAALLDGGIQAMDAGTASAAQNDLLYAASSAGADRAASVVTSLSGEVHADQAAAARSAGLGMQRDVSDHLATDRSADIAHNVWANVTRDGNRSVADGQGSGFETGTDRTTGGIDLYAESGTVLGVAATHHETNVIAHSGSGSIRGTSGMVYAQQALGRFVLDGVAAYGTTDWTTRRPDPVGASQLDARTSGKDNMASATLRMPMQTANGTRIEPYASVIWQKVERDAVSEHGSAAALSLDKLSETGTRVLAGVTMGSKASDPLATTLTWRAGVAVGADTGDLLDPTVHDTLAGQRFDTAAPGVGRSFVQVNANGTMRLGKNTYLYGGLTAEEGSRRSAYGVTAGVRVAF